MNKPITSYIRTAPSFNGGPVKQTEVETFTEGKKETKKENVDSEKVETKKNYAKDEQVCSSEYKAKTGKGGPGSKECQAWKNTSDEQKKKAETTIVEKCPEGSTGTPPNCVKETTTTTPGSRGDAFVETRQDVLQPWQARQQSRKTDMLTRKSARFKKRMLKYGNFSTDSEGNEVFTPNDNLSQKDLVKLEKNQLRYENKKQLLKNARTAAASGRLAGSNIRSGERNMSMSELAANQGSYQTQEKYNADKAAADAAAAERLKESTKNNIITSSSGQSSKAIEAGETAKPNQFAEAAARLKNMDTSVELGNYSVANNAVQMNRRPPLKKNYFKNK